jgi:hypothetical protein
VIESDFLRLQELRAVGGERFTSAGIEFIGVYESEPLQDDSQFAIDSYAPQILIRTSDEQRANIGDGSVIERGNRRYVVKGIRQDGTGMSVLIVEDFE